MDMIDANMPHINVCYIGSTHILVNYQHCITNSYYNVNFGPPIYKILALLCIAAINYKKKHNIYNALINGSTHSKIIIPKMTMINITQNKMASRASATDLHSSTKSSWCLSIFFWRKWHINSAKMSLNCTFSLLVSWTALGLCDLRKSLFCWSEWLLGLENRFSMLISCWDGLGLIALIGSFLLFPLTRWRRKAGGLHSLLLWWAIRTKTSSDTEMHVTLIEKMMYTTEKKTSYALIYVKTKFLFSWTIYMLLSNTFWWPYYSNMVDM